MHCEGLTLLDGKGRRIFFGRISEARHAYAQVASGWSGVCALPMVLLVADDGELLMDPVPELEGLRFDSVALRDIELDGTRDVAIEGAQGECVEIRVRIEWEDAEAVGIKVRCSPDGEEETLVRFNTKPNFRHSQPEAVRPLRELILDATRSSASSDVCN